MRSALVVTLLSLFLFSCAKDQREQFETQRRPMLTTLRVLKTVAEQNAEVAVVTGRQMSEPQRTTFLQGAELRYVRTQSLANAIIEDVALALETGTFATPLDQLRVKCDTMEVRFREFLEYLQAESGPRPAGYADDLKLITGTFQLIREITSGRRSAADAASLGKQIRLLTWRRWPGPSVVVPGASPERTSDEAAPDERLLRLKVG